MEKVNKQALKFGIFIGLIALGIGAMVIGSKNTLVNVFVLVLGFALLIKGADYFVDGASGIADKFGIPQIVIGLTIVAFGTSAPEAAVSISSALKGSTGLAVGNVLGSNILNILLILGITSCITTIKVGKNTVYYEMPFVIFITVVLVLMGKFNGKIDFKCGAILWVFFVFFFIYLIFTAKKGMGEQGAGEDAKGAAEKKNPMALLILFSICGVIAIVVGSDITVDSATLIAQKFGMSDRLIGLTIVAFGTSLPELVTSAIAATKKKADIAIGNVVGSNIFNVLFVLGTTALIETVNYEAAFIKDGMIAIAAAVLLFVCCVRKKQLGRIGGIVMLLGYAAYFVYLIR